MNKGERMALNYKALGDTFIYISVLDKAQKGEYKNDIIKLRIKSLTLDDTKFMTPLEALVIASGLNSAILMVEEKKQRLLG